jgi:pyruvate ferredoxin oxidoreductase gamma subunit
VNAEGRVGAAVEVRFHGRGGQGVVTAAELLSTAAFDQGRSAQAIPSFGSERTGAPVAAFVRVADRPIRSHDPVLSPDVVVVQDPTMLHAEGILAGLRPGGLLLVNSARRPEELGLTDCHAHVVTVAASDLARARLGRPLPNTALLGALARITGVVSLPALQQAIRSRFRGGAGEQNASLAEDGYDAAGARPEGARRAQAG